MSNLHCGNIKCGRSDTIEWNKDKLIFYCTRCGSKIIDNDEMLDIYIGAEGGSIEQTNIYEDSSAEQNETEKD
jgi:hypothetical protein